MGDPVCYLEYCPGCSAPVPVVDGACPDCGAVLDESASSEPSESSESEPSGSTGS
jgi:predicted amidophosphoribosyltransferase